MNNEITLLIDGNNTLHRTHWVANNTGRVLINSKGINTGGVFTFLKTVKSYVDQFNASRVYVAWDRKLTTEANFRNTLTEGTYKGTRDQARNKEVYDSMEDILNSIQCLGVRNIFPGKLEADDVISWLGKTIPGKKIIVSVDKDFIQLVAEDISYYNPIKKQLVDRLNFKETYGVEPKEYLYFKAILGDVSDNIPGIEGYGKVKALKLAVSYNVYKKTGTCNERHLQVIKNNEKTIEGNLKLMDLSYGLEEFKEETDLYSQQLNTLEHCITDFDKFKQICVDLEFNSILDRFSNWQATFNKKTNHNILTEYFKTFV
jgi:DNA polymerase I